MNRSWCVETAAVSQLDTEKLAEGVGDPIGRALGGDEDPEVRQTVEALYLEGEYAFFEEWDENQP